MQSPYEYAAKSASRFSKQKGCGLTSAALCSFTARSARLRRAVADAALERGLVVRHRGVGVERRVARHGVDAADLRRGVDVELAELRRALVPEVGERRCCERGCGDCRREDGLCE